MPHLRRARLASLASRASLASAAVATLIVLGGCVGGASQSAASSPSGGAGPSFAPAQSRTEWGLIWDSLPSGFPVYPGAEPVDLPSGPASATLDVPASVRAATEWWQAALEQAGYSTVAASGPLEDGSTVIDSAGAGDCRVQVAIAPIGGATTATILFGAACPYR